MQSPEVSSQISRPSTGAGYTAQLTFWQPRQTNPATSSRSVACGQTGAATAEINIFNLGHPWTSLVNLTPHDRLLIAYNRRSMAVARQLQEPQSCGGLHHGRRTQQLALRCQAAAPGRSGRSPAPSERLEPKDLRGVTLLLAAALTAQAARPQAAVASGIRWEPRRHYRRLARVVPDLEVLRFDICQCTQQACCNRDEFWRHAACETLVTGHCVLQTRRLRRQYSSNNSRRRQALLSSQPSRRGRPVICGRRCCIAAFQACLLLSSWS